MNDEKTNKIMSSEELDDVLPKYEPIKLSGKNLAQNYVSAFNTGMNIYQCVNQLQGNIDWTINAVNNVVKSWNTEVSESINQSKAIVRETTTEQFNTEWTNKQPELIEQVNTLTTNQFNNEKSVFNDELDTLNARMDTLNARMDTLNARMDTFSNHNLLINPDFKINQRGETSYTSAVAQTIKIVYSVDRWCLYGHSLTVNSDKSVTITPTTYSDGALIQNLETPVDGDITVQVYAVGVSGTATVSVGPSDGSSTTEIGTLKNGLNTFTFSKGIKRLVIRVKSGTLTLKYAKVEQGKVATSFVAPNPADELIKCRRYYNFTVSHFYGPTNPDGFINEDLATLRDFRTSPTFNINPTFSDGVTESTIAMKGGSTNGYYLYARTLTSGKYALDVTIRADAEIY